MQNQATMNRAALSFLGTPHISRRRLWWGVQLYKKRVIRTCVRMYSLERSIRARRSPGRRCTSRYTRWDRLRIPCRTRARKNRCRVAGLAWSSILVQRICERIFRHGMRQPWIVRVHRRDSLDALGKSGAFFRLDQSLLLAAQDRHRARRASPRTLGRTYTHRHDQAHRDGAASPLYLL